MTRCEHLLDSSVIHFGARLWYYSRSVPVSYVYGFTVFSLVAKKLTQMEVQWLKKRIYLIIVIVYCVNRPTNHTLVSTRNIFDVKKSIPYLFSVNEQLNKNDSACISDFVPIFLNSSVNMTSTII